MKADRLGYHCFLDRTGDTFRRTGENVSTTQVAEIICGVPPMREAAVYGVACPGCERRADEPVFDTDAARFKRLDGAEHRRSLAGGYRL